MRYLIFFVAVLFLAACADTDNPVVYTAPAGKVTEGGVKQPPGTNSGLTQSEGDRHGDGRQSSYTGGNVQDASRLNEQLDRRSTSSLPLGNGACEEIDENGNVVGRGPCGWQKAWDTGDRTIRETIQDNWRYEEIKDDVLPTVSVSDCKNGTNAVFTFSRTGPTTEGLSFSMRVYQGDGKGPYDDRSSTVTTGFLAGAASLTDQWSIPAVNGGKVAVKLIPGWENDMTDDYELGTSTALVNSSSSSCN